MAINLKFIIFDVMVTEVTVDIEVLPDCKYSKCDHMKRFLNVFEAEKIAKRLKQYFITIFCFI